MRTCVRAGGGWRWKGGERESGGSDQLLAVSGLCCFERCSKEVSGPCSARVPVRREWGQGEREMRSLKRRGGARAASAAARAGGGGRRAAISSCERARPLGSSHTNTRSKHNHLRDLRTRCDPPKPRQAAHKQAPASGVSRTHSPAPSPCARDRACASSTHRASSSSRTSRPNQSGTRSARFLRFRGRAGRQRAVARRRTAARAPPAGRPSGRLRERALCFLRPCTP